MKLKDCFLLLCIVFALYSCSKDATDDLQKSPVTDVTLPSPENPIKSGEPVTINGKGFTKQSEIWLRASIENRATGDVQATIVDVTSEYIRFTVPETIVGLQNILLKEAGKEYPLGKLTFEEKMPNPITSEKLYIVTSKDDSDNYAIYEITGKEAIKIYSLQDGTDMIGAVSIGGKVYYNTIEEDASEEEKSDLKYYDFQAKKEILIKNEWISGGGVAIGVIDGKLHGIKFDTTKGFSLVSIADNGMETMVSELGNPLGEDIRQSGDAIFDYEPVTKTIIIAGSFTERSKSTTISFNLSNKTSKLLSLEGIYSEDISYVVAENKVFRFLYKNGIGTTISRIDPQTLEDIEITKSIPQSLYSVVYMASSKLIIANTVKPSSIISFNPLTNEINTVFETDDELDVMFVATL